MKKALKEFKKYLNNFDFDFENVSIEQIVREFWGSTFGCSNPEREKELLEFWSSPRTSKTKKLKKKKP